MAMTYEARFVHHGTLLELEVVDPAKGVHESAIRRTRDEIVRLSIELRVHLVDHGLPELRRPTVTHGFRIVPRHIQGHPTVIQLEMLDLGLDVPGGERVDIAERQVVRNRNASYRDPG